MTLANAFRTRETSGLIRLAQMDEALADLFYKMSSLYLSATVWPERNEH